MISSGYSPAQIVANTAAFLWKWVASAFGASALIALAVMAAIWFSGQSLDINSYKPFATTSHRVIALLIVFICWLIGVVFVRWRTRGLKPPSPGKPVVQDPVELEIESMRQSFRNAVKTIRTKWTGEERGRQTLYTLPWYVVMGPPAVGKTSLLAASGMKFPLAHLLGLESFKSIKLTVEPQYWVTNDSVLFDLPGAWLRPASQKAGAETGKTRESRLWNAFSALLTEHRPRRPINGVILVLDICDLMRTTEEERGNLAASIHGRLVEMSEALETRFTIHIVVNKIDHLLGFRDYFQQFSKLDRLAPFGFSFDVYDELHADAWRETFATDFAAFMGRMNDDLIDRLYAQRDLTARKNIYMFTRQLSAAGVVLQHFLVDCLQADRFSTPPLVRGLYFTTTKQEGVPFNALLARISRDYALPAPVMPAYSGLSQPYFLAQLFADAIFTEAGLAGDNKIVERRKMIAVNATGMAAAAALITFGFYLFEAYRDNAARAASVVARTRDFVTLPQGVDASGEVALLRPAMDAIRDATTVFPDWHTKYHLLDYLALYQGHRIGPEIEKVYATLLAERFLPALAAQVKDRIIALGRDDATRDEDERLNLLRVYLLMGDKGKRDALDARPDAKGAPSKLGTRAIETWFSERWQGAYQGRGQVQDSLNGHLAHALEVSDVTVALHQPVIDAARADFAKVDRTQRILRRLERIAEMQHPVPVSFRKEIGPAFDLIFDQGIRTPLQGKDIQIPFLYTKKGFHDFFVPQNEQISAIVVEDAWVIGERDTIAYSPEDLVAFREGVLKRYVSTYIGVWDQAVNVLDITAMRNLDHAIAMLENVTGPANGIGRLLMLIKANSVVYEPKTTELRKDQPVKALDNTITPFDPNEAEGLRIVRRFDPLARIVTATGNGKPYMEEIVAKVGAVETYLREIRSGEASSKPLALERARERATLQETTDPISDLEKVGVNQPPPLNRIMDKLAAQSWKVVLEAARLDLQAVWQGDVYRSFSVSLANKYPFRKNAQEEVTLDEFQAFFGPKGTFDRFFTDYLATFVDLETRKSKLIDRQSIEIRSEFLAELEKLRQIRSIYFDAKGAPSLRYQIEPLSLSNTAGAAILNIEGQLVPYRHGPAQTYTILWPNASTTRNNASSLTVAGRSNGAITHIGVWSSFRLIDAARVTDVRGPADPVEMVFSVNGVNALYAIRALAPVNPFREQPLTHLRLPETL